MDANSANSSETPEQRQTDLGSVDGGPGGANHLEPEARHPAQERVVGQDRRGSVDGLRNAQQRQGRGGAQPQPETTLEQVTAQYAPVEAALRQVTRVLHPNIPEHEVSDKAKQQAQYLAVLERCFAHSRTDRRHEQQARVVPPLCKVVACVAARDITSPAEAMDLPSAQEAELVKVISQILGIDVSSASAPGDRGGAEAASEGRPLKRRRESKNVAAARCVLLGRLRDAIIVLSSNRRLARPWCALNERAVRELQDLAGRNSPASLTGEGGIEQTVWETLSKPFLDLAKDGDAPPGTSAAPSSSSIKARVRGTAPALPIVGLLMELTAASDLFGAHVVLDRIVKWMAGLLFARGHAASVQQQLERELRAYQPPPSDPRDGGAWSAEGFFGAGSSSSASQGGVNAATHNPPAWHGAGPDRALMPPARTISSLSAPSASSDSSAQS